MSNDTTHYILKTDQAFYFYKVLNSTKSSVQLVLVKQTFLGFDELNRILVGPSSTVDGKDFQTKNQGNHVKINGSPAYPWNNQPQVRNF